MEGYIVQELEKSLLAHTFLPECCKSELLRVTRALSEVVNRNGKVFFCGNGGSAAEAQHLAGEFIGRFKSERQPLPGIALTVDTSVLTAVSNDYGYDQVFSRQISALIGPGDALYIMSTSGNSPNVITAALTARQKGALTIGLTGSTGGQLCQVVDYCLRVPSDYTPHIQEAHLILGHVICSAIENFLPKSRVVPFRVTVSK